MLVSHSGYHWDCSDWARHSQTLPNITEVPGSEIPDSSSFHSNESNESRCHHLPNLVLGPLDPHRDIETLNEDESEFMADGSDSDPTTTATTHRRHSPSLNALDSGNEEYRFTTGTDQFFQFTSLISIHFSYILYSFFVRYLYFCSVFVVSVRMEGNAFIKINYKKTN